MTRITLDTNEYVSAFIGGAKASRVWVMGLTGDVEIATSEAILTEVIRVLREKFKWPPNALGATYQRLRSGCCLYAPTATLSVLTDEPDNRILECAAAANSEFIVTEDRDLLRIQQFGAVRIVTAAEFLAIFQGRSAEA